MVPEHIIEAVERLEQVQADIAAVAMFLESEDHHRTAIEDERTVASFLDAASETLIRTSLSSREAA